MESFARSRFSINRKKSPVANDGAFDWFVDPLAFALADLYSIRIRSVAEPAVLDVSSAAFDKRSGRSFLSCCR